MEMCDGKMDPATGLVTVLGTYDRKNYSCCIWNDLFSEEDKERLFVELTYGGFISLVCVSWLYYIRKSLALKKYLNEKTYRLLMQFVMAMRLRIFVPMLITMINQLNRGWYVSCPLSAFVESFLVILEVESLTHICIERFVVAKYVKNGWPMQETHYKRFFQICVGCAAVYSFVPLAISAYAFDFSCTSCTLDMVLLDDFSKYIIVVTHILKSFKPLTLMIGMLVAAQHYEANFDDEMKKRGESFYTNILFRVVVCTLMFWNMDVAVRSYVVFRQLQTKEIFAPPAVLVRIAFIWYQFSPAITSMVILLEDRLLQKKPPLISEQVQEKKNE